jgi:hypothetical protein
MWRAPFYAMPDYQLRNIRIAITLLFSICVNYAIIWIAEKGARAWTYGAEWKVCVFGYPKIN